MLRQLSTNRNFETNQIIDLDRMAEEAARAIAEVHCPYCGVQGDFIKWGSYKRGLVEWISSVLEENGIPKEEIESVQYRQIKVQRVRCNNCGHTHAVLAPGIVPYRRFALAFMLTAIAEYMATGEAVKISDRYGISPQTLYAWNRTFRRQMQNTGNTYVAPREWIETWPRRLTAVFQQRFLQTNQHLLLEHLRPKTAAVQKLPCKGSYLLWPGIGAA